MSKPKEFSKIIELKDINQARVFMELTVLARQVQFKKMPLEDFLQTSFSVLFSLAMRHKKKEELALLIADFFKSENHHDGVPLLQTVEMARSHPSGMRIERYRDE